MDLQYQLNHQIHRLFLQRSQPQLELRVDEFHLNAQVHWHNQHSGYLQYKGDQFPFCAAQNEAQLFLHMFGHHWVLQRQDLFSQGDGEEENSGQILAPMPGVVIDVHVEAEQEVAAGDSLMLIESMKLQTEIKTEHDGHITRIDLQAGASFDKGTLLVEVTPLQNSNEV